MKRSNMTITPAIIALSLNPFRAVRGRALSHREFLPSLISLLLIFGMFGGACRKQPEAVKIKGPILDMTVATAFDDKGRPQNPGFAFAPTEPKLVVIVQVGRLDSGASRVGTSRAFFLQLGTVAAAAADPVVNIAWYHTSDEGEQKLFEHHVNVHTYDRAYSIGKSKGTLKSGTYKVKASLVGQTQEIELEVREAKARNSSGALPQASIIEASVVESEDGAGQGAPPVDGGSGTIPRPSGAGSGDQYPWTTKAVPASRCKTVFESFSPIDPYSNIVGSFLQQYCPPNTPGSSASPPDTSLPFDIQAGIDGAASLSSIDAIDLGGGFGLFILDPCTLKNGSDLPGTKVVFTGLSTSEVDASDSLIITLGPDQDAPKVSVNSSPPKGTKVKPGDVIKIDATASERRDEATWQTGVQLFQLVGPEGKITDVMDPRRLPKPCASKSWSKVLEASYKVPDNPPPVIKLCAIAEDYAGNESFKCGEFPTVDVWEGTLQTDVTVAVLGRTCTGYWQAKIKILASENGTASGEISVVDAPMNSCGGSTYAILGSKWPITGVINDAGFTFPLSQFVGTMVQGSAFIQKSGRSQASGTATPSYSPGAGQTHSFVMQFELKCKTCGTG